eukprot:gene39718-53699_t
MKPVIGRGPICILNAPGLASASSAFAGSIRTSRALATSDLVARKICDHDVALYCSRDYAIRRGTPTSTADLASHDLISFHVDAGPHPHRTLQAIRAQGKKAGIVLNPGTPACLVERHFAEPMLDLDGLQEVVARLIAEAARVLEQRGEGGRIFELGFHRSDGAVRRLVIETGRPTRDGKAILRLLRERIESLSDPLDPGFGFDAVRLAVPVCEPLSETQPSLDRRAVEDEAVADLVDRLVVRFGRDRVLRFVAQD